MKDPIRLRDAKSPHSRAARDLLRSSAFGRPSGSGIGVRGLAGPTLDQRDAMWANLAAAIGPMPPPHGGDGGGDGGGAGTGVGDVDVGAAASASGASASGIGGATAHVSATVAKAAATQVAATSGAAAIAAPAGKAALSLGAAKLWLALGIGAAGSIGTAAYVASPASSEAPRAADVAVAALVDTASRAAPQLAEKRSVEPRIAEPPIVEARDAARTSPAAPVDAAKAPRSSDPVPAKQVEPKVGRVAEPIPAPAASLTPAERASRLRDEAKATADARVALRSGDAAGALRRLADANRDFGGGAMGQEREALTIEALARSGARDAASARAAAFIAQWPNSAYAAAVRPFVVESNPK